MSNFVIKPTVRTDNITYAVEILLYSPNETAKTGKEMLYLSIVIEFI